MVEKVVQEIEIGLISMRIKCEGPDQSTAIHVPHCHKPARHGLWTLTIANINQHDLRLSASQFVLSILPTTSNDSRYATISGCHLLLFFDLDQVRAAMLSALIRPSFLRRGYGVFTPFGLGLVIGLLIPKLIRSANRLVRGPFSPAKLTVENVISDNDPVESLVGELSATDLSSKDLSAPGDNSEAHDAKITTIEPQGPSFDIKTAKPQPESNRVSSAQDIKPVTQTKMTPSNKKVQMDEAKKTTAQVASSVQKVESPEALPKVTANPPDVPPCAVDGCNKPGTLLCGSCDEPKTRYCGSACQKQHWTIHKRDCVGAQKHNCFIIRAASPPGSTSLADRIEGFCLQSYGTEWGEIEELKRKLDWPAVKEAGKFYPHQESVDDWYFYMYASTASGLPVNDIATRCSHNHRVIRGDVAVVRSGPADYVNYEALFSKTELVKTINYYRTADPEHVFAARESSRFFRRFRFLGGIALVTPYPVY